MVGVSELIFINRGLHSYTLFLLEKKKISPTLLGSLAGKLIQKIKRRKTNLIIHIQELHKNMGPTGN